MGMKGWQWLFIIEAVPALILSVVVFFYLTDRPADATWLEPDERAWLVSRLEQEQRQRETARTLQRDAGAAEPEGAGAQRGLFRRGGDQLRAELLPAADRQGVRHVERADRAGVGAAVCGRDWSASCCGGDAPTASSSGDSTWRSRCSWRPPGSRSPPRFDDPTMKMIALSIAGFGIFGSLPVFWTLPTAFLSGAAAAGGIAMINSIGNLAGFAGPYAMGRSRIDRQLHRRAAVAVGGVGLIAMAMVLRLGHDSSLEHAPGTDRAVEARPASAASG